jgi:hypothetical protein
MYGLPSHEQVLFFKIYLNGSLYDLDHEVRILPQYVYPLVYTILTKNQRVYYAFISTFKVLDIYIYLCFEHHALD